MLYLPCESSKISAKFIVKVLKNVFILLALFFLNLVNAACDGRFYLHFRNSLAEDKTAQIKILKDYGLNDFVYEFEKYSFGKFADVVTVNTCLNIDSIKLIFEKERNIQFYKTVNHTYFSSPNDSLYNLQWYLNTIQAEGGWYYSKGNNEIKIGVVDDAIDVFQRDLRDNIFINTNEILNNNSDDDNNGIVDDYYGADVTNFTGNVQPPNSSFNHGTHVAALAAASTNNISGIASVAYNCKLIAVKASTSNTFLSHGPQGVAYAVEAGANVVNMSWGSTEPDLLLKMIIDSARINKNVVFVASAGNFNLSTEVYPAAWEGVIAVSSSNQADQKVASSSFGPWIDIAAPGYNVLSVLTPSGYVNRTGTSQAAPLVAGTAALMLSLKSWMLPHEIDTCLKIGSDPLPLFNVFYGYGRLNMQKAIECILYTLGENEMTKKEEPVFLYVRNNQSLVVSKPKENSTYFIYDISGKVLSSGLLAGNNEIDISALQAGIYLFNLDSVTLRFIKI